MREGVREEVGYIAPIEGLRGVAVLWVVAFHYVTVRGAADPRDGWVAALGAFGPLDQVVRNGYLGVDLFFLISGFLLALPWFVHARSGIAAPSAARFYARRIRRIVPAYYLQVLLLFTLVMPLLHGRTYWRSDLWVFLWNGIAHGLFLQNSTPLTASSLGVNGALWTLAVEAQFYALLPLVAPLFVRAPLRMLAAGAAVSFAWNWAALHDLRPLVDAQLALGAHWHWSEATVRGLLALQLPAFAGHFALGIALGRGWLAWRERPPAAWPSATTPLAAIGALALLYAALTGLAPGLARPAAALALGILLFAATLGRSTASRTLLGRGPLAFAGRVSYSAYLYHLPLLMLWNAFVPAAGGWLTLPAYAAALACVSWLSWRYVEQPFLAARTRAHRERGEDREDLEHGHAP
jgi:peptidoglycan/LPS O-acetylase OafA/YrhL